MLHVMDNMEASRVSYVKFGTFTQVEQTIISLLTVDESRIVKLTVQHDLIVSASFKQYLRDYLRQTSADVLCFKQYRTII
jgi:hypothetical protein